MTTKQRLHINALASKKRKIYKERLENLLSYDLNFYKFKNGKLNISKMSRCSGLSRSYLERELWRRGL